MYCKCRKINSNRGGKYIVSRDWIKNKKATANNTNKQDDKCFQYIVTVGLNLKEIGKNLERITKIKPIRSKYDWEETNFSSEKDDWKKFEKNKRTITLNVLHAKKEKVYPAYISKHNSSREKQVTLFMIPNGENAIILQ